jgi:hypothetical protein
LRCGAGEGGWGGLGGGGGLGGWSPLMRDAREWGTRHSEWFNLVNRERTVKSLVVTRGS